MGPTDARLTPVFSILGLLSLWVIAAFLTDDAQVLPQPWSLVPLFVAELASGELPTHLGATLLRAGLTRGSSSFSTFPHLS